MITEDLINDRISNLQKELAQLNASHASLVRDEQEREQRFKQIVTENQTRFQQLTGAIAELTELKNQTNGEKPNT